MVVYTLSTLPSCSKALHGSHCLQNQVQIPKCNSQELARLSTSKPFTASGLQCSHSVPDTFCLPLQIHTLPFSTDSHPGSLTCGNSQGWWLPGWAWPVGEGRGQARGGAKRRHSVSRLLSNPVPLSQLLLSPNRTAPQPVASSPLC